MLAVLPDDARGELLDGMAGYSTCGFHCHQWEACFLGCYAAAGRAADAPPTFVARLGPDVDVLEEEAASPASAAAAALLRADVGGRRIVARTDRDGAVEEHRAGMLAVQELALPCGPRVAWPGACTWRSPVPSRQGLAEHRRWGRRSNTRPSASINHAFGDGDRW